MPNSERLLRTLHQARQAFLSTPGRQGRMITLDNVEEVMVAGDMHGHLENFRRILLVADLKQSPRRHLVLQELVHGPFRYPDGSDKSHQLLDLMAALKCQYPSQVHMLLGNHELAQWTNQWIAKAESDLNALFRAGVEFAYAKNAGEIYQAYLDLFPVIPLAVKTSNRVFVSHSLPSASRLELWDPGFFFRDWETKEELLPGGSVYSLVWGRDTKLATVTRFLQKVDADWLISGHIPGEKGFIIPNDRQIILDSMGTSAGFCLFPANRPVSHHDLVECIKLL
jgi:hypothetical protein